MEVWAKATVANGDKVHTADSTEEDLLGCRDATFVRVRKLRHSDAQPPGLTLPPTVFVDGGQDATQTLRNASIRRN